MDKEGVEKYILWLLEGVNEEGPDKYVESFLGHYRFVIAFVTVIPDGQVSSTNYQPSFTMAQYLKTMNGFSLS